MAAVTVTKTSIADFNTITTVTANPTTEDGAGTAQAYEITITEAPHRVLIFLHNVATDQGTVTYSIAAGAFPQAGAALTGSVAQGVLRVIELDAKYISAANLISITVTPATGKQLTTNHKMQCYCVQQPF